MFKRFKMSNNLEEGLCNSGWSEEHDCVPLRLRLKMLYSSVSKPNVVEAGLASDEGRTATISAFRMEEGILDSEVPASEAKADDGEEQLKIPVGDFLHQTSSSAGGVLDNSLAVSTSTHVEATKVKHESIYEFGDDLDNVVLRDRRKMLLSRKLTQSSALHVELQQANKVDGLSNTSKAVMESAGIQKQESDSIHDTLMARSLNRLANGFNCHDSNSGSDGTSHKNCSLFSSDVGDVVSVEVGASPTFADCQSLGTQEITSIPDAITTSALPFHAKVKDELVDIKELLCERNNAMQNFNGGEMLTVKTEPVFSELVDELDHLPLIDRVKLVSSGTPSMYVSDSGKIGKEDVDVDADVLESIEPISISRLRKRRRTATNSVETALEEDAPGLLKVLVERGVLVEDIKLYGEEESDDDLDDSLSDDGFAELEGVISQLFSQRPTFLKFPILHTKGERISYCLSCLLSLVEQTKYLRKRKWPVEWGWCRDLQSFIFVFERHNRIVLERPEYGYATYFFELLNFVPVAWQVKRLVTAMKLTSCGRITLIENRPLVVGDDLSEEEARVLAEYGWTPNTGLGTMLNYCDRVVHDRKQELNSSEWRSKIGRQLMHGYNGGNIVSKSIPRKLTECQGLEEVQVKLEQ